VEFFVQPTVGEGYFNFGKHKNNKDTNNTNNTNNENNTNNAINTNNTINTNNKYK